jgi:hypothetical protein
MRTITAGRIFLYWVLWRLKHHMKRDYDHLLRRQVFAACFCGERNQEESEGEGD